jgi:hypothetical protein
MRTKNFVVLLVLAAVVCGLAYLSHTRKRTRIPAAASLIGSPVLPALADVETLNGVERIVFTSADQTVRVARVENRWVAPDKYGYPLDFEKVRRFLRSMADLKVGQVLRADTAQLASLNLVDPADAPAGGSDGTGTQVRLEKGDGSLVASILVGKERSRPSGSEDQFGGYPDGRFVLADSRPFLVSETFSDLPEDAKDWLDEDLANVSSFDVASITITGDGDDALTFQREGESGSFKLADLAEDEEMETSKSSSLANALSYLTFVDVADPALTDTQLGMDAPVVMRATTKKGAVYTLTVGGKAPEGDDRYARLNASYTPPPEPAEEPPAEGEEETDEARKAREDAAAKRRQEQEKLAKEVKELNAKFADWTYVLRSYKVDAISAERATYVKKKETKPDPEADSAQTPPAVGEADTAAGAPEKGVPAADPGAAAPATSPTAGDMKPEDK